MDLVQRAKAMVLAPAAEWRAIEPESGDAAYLFVNYVAPLAAIPPASEFLWRHVLYHSPRLHAHYGGFFSGLFTAFIHWLVTFVVVYAMAVVVDGLAPTFGALKNRENAMKLISYSMTPAWLAGVFALVPGLWFLRVLALIYSIYLFWLGLPLLMKPQPNRTQPYALATMLCAFLLWAVIGAVVRPSI